MPLFPQISKCAQDLFYTNTQPFMFWGTCPILTQIAWRCQFLVKKKKVLFYSISESLKYHIYYGLNNSLVLVVL